jgi:hypothetical protein
MTATVAYCQANTISGHSGTRRDPTSPFHCCQTGVIEAPFLTSSPDVYVCYMESCGLASVPAVALCLGRRRWLLSLLSRRSTSSAMTRSAGPFGVAPQRLSMRASLVGPHPIADITWRESAGQELHVEIEAMPQRDLKAPRSTPALRPHATPGRHLPSMPRPPA